MEGREVMRWGASLRQTERVGGDVACGNVREEGREGGEREGGVCG